MTDGLSFAVSRERTKWDGMVYECRECHAEAGAVAALNHDDGCRVATTDKVISDNQQARIESGRADVFHVSTWEVIRAIERQSEFALRDQDADTDELTEALSEVKGVRWTATGSTHRVIVGIGRTSPRGAFHRDDQRGVVVKVDPRIRFNEDYTPVSSNLDSISTWETAVATDTTQFFADIFSTAPDGMWVAMEYCIPISLRIRNEMHRQDMLHDDGGEQYIYPLVAALKQAGWEDPDYKHANVGLTDQGRSVLIDYGTGPEYVAGDETE